LKIIVSHDVDHLTLLEHKKDLIVPKFFVRSSIELLKRKISSSEYLRRVAASIRNKWQNIEELMEYDRGQGVGSTFFVAVRRGGGLSYGLKDAKRWVQRIQNEGFDVGLHGICVDAIEAMRKEHEMFASLSGTTEFGIRMHNLKTVPGMLSRLDKLGYVFDSTYRIWGNPERVGSIFEFPLHIMDGHIMHGNKKFTSLTLSESIRDTKAIIRKAFEDGVSHLTILFHDRYFEDGFMTVKQWYMYTIEYLKENRFEFTDFKTAVGEMEQ